MRIFRIAKQQYLTDLSGEGARLYGGRWNKRGSKMVYFSESLSLCVLEILVHLDFKYLNNDFGYIAIDLPEDSVETITTKQLSPNWRVNPPQLYTQDFGTKWLNSNKTLALKVPSAVLPLQSNILINPNHELLTSLKIVKKGKLNLDSRMFKG